METTALSIKKETLKKFKKIKILLSMKYEKILNTNDTIELLLKYAEGVLDGNNKKKIC